MDAYRKQDREQKKEEGRRQRAILRKFDANLFTYTGQIAWLWPVLGSFLELILMAIPVQEYMADEDRFMMFWLPFFFAFGISYALLWPYTILSDGFTPQQKNAKISRKLRYLPISRRQFIYVRLGYLHRYLWKVTAIGLALQCLFALGIEKQIGIINILYVVAVLYAGPMILGGIQLLTDMELY